jgi:3'-phosphoadenosine 5'-phosphosulfate sulfotransferase (PAPS reductase)/FAD synthetase
VTRDRDRGQRQIVAFSGGKDSTALALRMAELGEDFDLLFTPTGNELPELQAHVEHIARLVGRPLVQPAGLGLDHWIEEFNALPNWRQRWCTRLIKIEPCIAYIKASPGDVVLCVGLRADEEERQGLYGSFASYRYPLREWGWGVGEVWGYIRERGVTVPKRTDCAVCPYQRLGEWFDLWSEHPDEYAQGEEWERITGYTFRSPGRDSWPASLAELRAEFEAGRFPKGKRQLQLIEDDASQACRVCRL